MDGGVPGRSRDAWAAWRATPDGARIPVTVRGGQFTLNLPVDPETFRETSDHYAIWDQTAGDNPFAFFEPKLGPSGIRPLQLLLGALIPTAIALLLFFPFAST